MILDEAVYKRGDVLARIFGSKTKLAAQFGGYPVRIFASRYTVPNVDARQVRPIHQPTRFAEESHPAIINTYYQMGWYNESSPKALRLTRMIST